MTPLEGALAAVSAGWHVFPLRAGEKRPANANGLNGASLTVDRTHAGNWGVNCGASGLIVVDLDPRNGATADLLDELPQTFTVRTGGGGWHAYFRGECKSRTGLMPGVDIQSVGKYVVLAGSVTSAAYIIERELPILDAPEWLIAAANAGQQRTASVVETDCPAHLVRDDRRLQEARKHLANLDAAIEGDGGTPAWTAAGILQRGYLLPQASVDALMRAEWCPRCVPPWCFEAPGDEANWQHTLDSAERTFPMPWGEKVMPLLGSSTVVAESLQAPTQDVSGLQLAPTGWPWVLRAGQWCWLHDPTHKRYGNEIPKTDIRLQARRTHSRLIRLRTEKGADISEADFEQMYQHRVATLKATYLARENTWDPQKCQLTIAALTWADLPPTFDTDVDRWLRALGGHMYDRLAQWLASCVALNRPAPALYIHGNANVGKTLLARGLAKIWSCDPAPFKEALDSFNEAAASCPLMFADEGFPEGMSFNDFREMVTSPSRRVNQKYKPKYAVEGCVRVILAANNDAALRYQRTGALTAADLHAVADRLLVINASSDAQTALVGVDKDAFSRYRIASHVLWLAQTTPLEDTDRRMCAQPAGAMTVLDALQTAKYSAIMRVCATATEHEGVLRKDGRILVNVNGLYKACTPEGRDAFKVPREQDVRDFVNAFRGGPPEQHKRRTMHGDDQNLRYHPLDVARFRHQLESLD